MFKFMRYALILLSISISSTFAMDNDTLESGTITVHFRNDVSGIQDIPSTRLRNQPISGVLPYIIHNLSDSSFSYTRDIKVLCTMLDTDGNSFSLLKPLPRTEGSIRFELPFKDRTKLLQVSLQVQGTAFIAASIKEDGKLDIDGDHRSVGFSSIWHSLVPGTTGWLQGDSLYAYFKKDLNMHQTGQPNVHSYIATFGTKFNQ